AVKVRSHVQRTSYKASEKLAVRKTMKKNTLILHQVGAGRVSFYPAAEEKLVIWLNELRQMGIAVTVGSIKIQIFKILLTTCADKYPGASQRFHASNSCQKLPEDLTDKIIEFHKFVIQSRLRYVSQIINMDEAL
ncbi:14768_t:CDS:2, partial [Gigaspora rosea]